VELLATAVRRYSNGETVWTYEQMRDETFPAATEGTDTEQFEGGE
jgi:hypothetical protein